MYKYTDTFLHYRWHFLLKKKSTKHLLWFLNICNVHMCMQASKCSRGADTQANKMSFCRAKSPQTCPKWSFPGNYLTPRPVTRMWGRQPVTKLFPWGVARFVCMTSRAVSCAEQDLCRQLHDRPPYRLQQEIFHPGFFLSCKCLWHVGLLGASSEDCFCALH